MSKNKLVTPGIIILLAIALVALLYYNPHLRETPGGKNFIDKIREENKAGLDSLQRAINNENNLNYRIKKSISNGNFKLAYTLMDSLPPFGKAPTIHLYKGMIYAKQNKYPEAIEEFSISIDEEPSSLALDKRAEAYISINKPDSALDDYKEAYSWNLDYSFQIGSTFELMHKKDSAQKYYQVFLEHYPNDTRAQQKLSQLKSK